MRWSKSGLCGAWVGCALVAALGVACTRDRDPGAAGDPAGVARPAPVGSVTISGDDAAAARLTWHAPAVDLAAASPAQLRGRAAEALAEGRLHEDADAAVPIYLALSTLPEHSRAAADGLRRALRQLLARGDRALALAAEDDAALQQAAQLAAVARTVDARDPAVVAFLERVDLAERVAALNQAGERALAAGELGEGGGGAQAAFNQALALVPGQPRARQGLAAVESALIRRAEDAAAGGDFDAAARWLAYANEVRPDSGVETVADARGAFVMGAPDGERDASDYERPAHAIRFARGFGMSIREISVGQYRRFIAATGHRTRASRRGFSMVYDERSNNFVRRSGADWHTDYLGRPADDGLPVVHVSARDAQAYADWLSEQTGHRYRLPSEAEFEYALRAGVIGRYPWGDGGPPPRVANTTGALDRSPAGRNWANAFDDYGDGYWGPAPVGSLEPNAWGLHDLSGNVSEWVADCWHDGYRRAPGDGSAWINPGCRTQVIRGGSWASSPAQTRSAWRAPASVDTTNARLGFRVVRDL